MPLVRFLVIFSLVFLSATWFEGQVGSPIRGMDPLLFLILVGIASFAIYSNLEDPHDGRNYQQGNRSTSWNGDYGVQPQPNVQQSNEWEENAARLREYKASFTASSFKVSQAIVYLTRPHELTKTRNIRPCNDRRLERNYSWSIRTRR
jgi:hypothetical protein